TQMALLEEGGACWGILKFEVRFGGWAKSNLKHHQSNIPSVHVAGFVREEQRLGVGFPRCERLALDVVAFVLDGLGAFVTLVAALLLALGEAGVAFALLFRR